MRIGFAGAGNMAAAMARGWASGDGGPDAMLFCDLVPDRAAKLAQEVGGEVRDDLAALARDCEALVLAVKPGALDEVAAELEGRAPPLVSMLAATPTARLSEAFPNVPALRLMPNQPVEVRRGILCYVPSTDMPTDLLQRLLELLRPLGTLVALDEPKIDPAMAIMSSSPAYIALVAEALTRAGEQEGLDGALAAELVTGALAGTAELLRVREPAAIRAAVVSPGGATEAGLARLEGVVEDAFLNAVGASLERFR
jgi:pyrroline-5-carboxylate reductase